MTGSSGVHCHLALQGVESLSSPVIRSAARLNINFPKSKAGLDENINSILLKKGYA